MPPSVTYGIDKNPHGRWVVTSPKGTLWKTTYPSRAAAEKAVAYIEGRFGGPGSSPPTEKSQTTSPSSSPGDQFEELDEAPDTGHDRAILGIPPKITPDEDTEGW